MGGSLCTERERPLSWVVEGRGRGQWCGDLQTGVTSTQPVSWAHRPGPSGMKQVGPDSPKKGKETSHSKWPLHATPGAGRLLRQQRVPGWQKGHEGLCLPNGPSLHPESGSLGNEEPELWNQTECEGQPPRSQLCASHLTSSPAKRGHCGGSSMNLLV